MYTVNVLFMILLQEYIINNLSTEMYFKLEKDCQQSGINMNNY